MRDAELVPALTCDLLIPRGHLLDEELPESTAINDACKRGRANRRPAGASECSREAVECFVDDASLDCGRARTAVGTSANRPTPNSAEANDGDTNGLT